MGKLTRRADLGSVDMAARSVPVVVATTAPVMRDGLAEVLDMARCDLSRGDLPLIESHDTGKVNVGIVRSLRVDGDRLRGVAVFGVSARASELLADVLAGVVRGLSLGYRHADAGQDLTLPDGSPARTYGFMPYEVSVVSVPADVRAGFNRSHPGVLLMTTATIDRTADDAQIRDIATRHRLPASFAEDLIERGMSTDQARGAILEHLARRDAATGGHHNVRTVTPSASPNDEMVTALVNRGTGTAAPGNAYARASVADLCREFLERGGVRTTAMTPANLVERALSTSDFPSLLANVAGKSLALGYEQASAGHTLWTSERDVADFKQQSLVNLSEAPGLEVVPKLSEYRFGALTDSASTFQLATFGKILQISRQALINDDVSAFTRLPQAFGAAARRLEADKVYSILTTNAALADGKALFHADHGNLAASGTALSVTSLGAARAAMRKQKGIASLGYLDIQPAFVIVPTALETLAEQLLASLVDPAKSNDTGNAAFVRGLTLIADPRLDEASATAWYLAASPAQTDHIVRAYLAGQPRPFLEENQEFTVDAVSFKTRLDLAVGVVGYAGLYKNPGA